MYVDRPMYVDSMSVDTNVCMCTYIGIFLMAIVYIQIPVRIIINCRFIMYVYTYITIKSETIKMSKLFIILLVLLLTLLIILTIVILMAI